MATKVGLDWERFPDDVLLRIFHYLPLVDRVRLESVNSRWHSLLQKSWIDVGALIVWRDSVYEETSKDADIDPDYVANGGVSTVQSVLKKASGNLRSLKFVDTPCIDREIVATITQSCRNLEALELHKVVFPEEISRDSVQIVESLLLLPNLSTVAWNQNLVTDDAGQQQQVRRVNAGVQMALFPSINAADAFTVANGLRQLHLEDAPLLWGNFVYLCVQLAPTLEEFCYKIWDHFLVPLRCTLVRGLQHLVNLKQLNIGGERRVLRPLGGLLDDDFALFVSHTMPRLERLSVKAAERLGVRGVKALVHNLPRLKYLNLNQCDSINNSVLEAACESRFSGAAYLTIYANETDVSLEKLNIKSDHVSVLSNPRFMDESAFFGEGALAE